jgi:transposase
MRELAKSLKEYEVVVAMPGVGEILGPRLIAEIGDVRRFQSAGALIGYAGLDSPPSNQATSKLQRFWRRVRVLQGGEKVEGAKICFSLFTL